VRETTIEKTTTNTAPEEQPKTLLQHLRLKYPIEIVEEEDGVVASLPDLPGCVSYGDTIQDAVESLNATKELWIKGRLESGQPVPKPSEVEDFSGKFVLRIPRGLHRSLDREAKKQGVSLNTYVLHLLTERHAMTKFESYLSQAMLTATGSSTHADPNWAEESILKTYRFSGSSSSLAGRSALLMIDFVPKPKKSFSQLLKLKQLPPSSKVSL